MDKDFSILKFLSQTFTIYGVTTLLLNIFCVVFGEAACGVSTIFSLGSSGVSVASSLQFLLAVFVISGLRFVFMTNLIFKKMPVFARVIAMFAGAFAITVIFIRVFDWFPADMPQAWVMFIISFVLSCAASTLVSLLAERRENRRLEEALKHFKEEL